MRVVLRGFQSVVDNRRPFLAVQTHVPPENLVVSNTNEVLTVLCVTDAVQTHVVELGVSWTALHIMSLGYAGISAQSICGIWWIEKNNCPAARVSPPGSCFVVSVF